MTERPRDRLRELLDAVLDEDNHTLDEMATGAFTSRFHFSRLLARGTGEAPVSMRRRVMLERAAWRLRNGDSVTDAAWAAGYESVDGFSRAFTRAFGHPPSTPAASHWLPAPNGIHFHPPTSLWVQAREQSMNPLTEQLIAHDLDDTRSLLDTVGGLGADDLRRARMPGLVVLEWDGPEESVLAVLEHLVLSKEVWLAAIEGLGLPQRDDDPDIASLTARHDAAAPRWLATVRDIDRRGGWDDRLIDALCDPPESFVLSSVIAHVLTFAAHRRLLVRQMLRAAGHRVDDGDPIIWHRTRGRPC